MPNLIICLFVCGDARGLLRLAMRPLRLLLSLSKPGTLITRQEFGASLWQLLQEFTLSYVRLCPRGRIFKQARVLATRAQTNQTHAYSVRRRSRLQIIRTTTNGVMGGLERQLVEVAPVYTTSAWTSRPRCRSKEGVEHMSYAAWGAGLHCDRAHSLVLPSVTITSFQ